MNALIEPNSFGYSVCILLFVMVVKSLVTHFVYHEPLRFFQLYCHLLGNKVNKSKNSAQQQSIAGFVGVVVTLVPIALILWLFEAFVEVKSIWQGLLLYVSLGAFGLKQVNKSIAQALVAKQSYLAKKNLSVWVLRETEQLSSLGVSKAAIEMQLLRHIQQGYVVACIYLLSGPLAALCYRLLLEMHFSWNIKRLEFHYFGAFVNKAVKVCQWLPVRLFSLLLLLSCVGQNALLFWRLSRRYFFQLNTNYVILLLALRLEVKLGGVAMYKQHKLRRVSFNDLAKQPQATDIIHADSQIKQVTWLSIIGIVFMSVAASLVRS